MSRLDSAIRRLEAQRLCLDGAARLVADRPGPVIELGLGNGRTFDHLRDRLPGRAIYAFERQLAAHPGSIPEPPFLVMGDFRETLAQAVGRMERPPVLAHADFGSGDAASTNALAAWLGRALPPLMAPAAIVASDQDLPLAGATRLALPDGVAEGRYFLWRLSGPA
jgi:hypothetical protein